MPLSICLSDPQGRDEAVTQEGAKNSVKKSPFWDPSIESERAREPRGSPVPHPYLTLLARCECLKRHGVGEREGGLGAGFIVLPRHESRNASDHESCATFASCTSKFMVNQAVVTLRTVKRSNP
jgi:hypothetical protein